MSSLKNKSVVVLAAMVCAFAACSPALNWREIRPAGSGAVALFPCKPDRFTRSVVLGSEKLQMVLNSCAADGATYALSHAELADAAHLNAALEAMHAAAASNLGGSASKVAPLVVPGMAPHVLAQRWAVQGKPGLGKTDHDKTENNTVKQQFAVFTRGLRVYQATVVGKTLDATAVDTFFGSLQLPP